MTRQAFIIGGSGQIGRAVASHLLDQGWTVTLASRGSRPVADLAGRGAKIVTLDRGQATALAKALGGGADAVIDTIAYTEAHGRQLLDVQGDVGAFAVISSASVYCDAFGRSLGEANFPRPIREDETTVDPGPETYASRKVALERCLLDEATRPVVILRPCAIHGLRSVHPREWWFVKRMLDRRPVIPMAYGGQGRFHTSAVVNIAGLVAAALEHGGSHVLNSGDPQAPSVAEIGALIGQRLGYGGEFLSMTLGEEVGAEGAGDTPWSTPTSFVLDLERGRGLGYAPVTTYEDAVGAICDELVVCDRRNWQALFPVLAAYPCDLFDYAAEDRFLAGRH